MELVIEFSIYTNRLTQNQFKKKLEPFPIKEVLFLKDGGDDYVSSGFIMDYDPKWLHEIRKSFTSKGIELGERYCPIYTNEEYEHAPLFQLHTLGREHDRASRTKYRKEIICDKCQFYTFHLDGSLGMNTNRLRNKIMVNVDYRHWVLTEEGAELFDKWGITGYQLTPVRHTGQPKHALPGYVISGISLLPEAGTNSIRISKEGTGCNHCMVESYWTLPIYDQTITEHMKDINLGAEYNGLGTYGGVRGLFISNRLRKLLLENRITKEVQNPYIPGKQNLRINGWYMDPVMIE